MGITQHTTGTDNVKSCANLAMLTGNMGIPGGGVNPLRGQNNVQGACDMGGLPNVYPGYQKVTSPEVQKKFEDAWGGRRYTKVGLTMTEMVNAAGDGKLRALYVMGENPMISDPEPQPRPALPGAGRVPGGAGHLPDRDGATGARGAAGGLVRRERRHLHQHRPARPASAARRSSRSARPRPTGRSSACWPSAWARPGFDFASPKRSWTRSPS